jgi:hypothetical protein
MKIFYSTGVVSPSGDVTDIDGNAKTKYLKKRKRIIIIKRNSFIQVLGLEFSF